MVLYPHSTDRSVLPSDRDLLYWSVAFDGQRLFAACLTQCSNLAKAGDSIEIRETHDALTMSSERLGSYAVSAQRCFGNINTLGENPLGAIVVLGFATDFPCDVVVARSNGVALTRVEIKDTRAKLMQRYAQPERESILEPVPVGELGVERTASAFVLAPSR